ncbi:energy-coupling factor transporter transmembrane component T family protein [Rhizobium paknamense]|uniref:Biotin transport system permease protein n=1 Tax=Rhizobium paknamense TaxID=1206817 RepID=A0ABU0IBP3_9HYPH|nr:energy-coupling factor transporter transmembrane protein EcfT [Rhizobium paknamense]MDQ0455063.1 biotin transport system permease protein [Rhizobium paknamense]
MMSLYVQRRSLLHRLPAAVKLVALAFLALAVLALPGLVPLVIAALLAFGLYLHAGLQGRAGLAALKPLALSIALIALFTALVAGPREGAETLFRLLSLTLLATAVTASTPLHDFMAVIERAARPLERAGLVRAADIGLAVGLALRFLPEVVNRYRAIAEAHQARGLKLRATTLLGPLIISTLREADAIAAAIDARGIRGHEKEKRET